VKLKNNNRSEATYALVTVTDSSFLVGTLILFHSFLKHNPWFTGDLVVIESDLNEQEKKLLSVFPNLLFHTPNKQILERTEILGHFWKTAHENSKQFYSIEAFGLNKYKKVLLLDSDILCLENINNLFFEFNDCAIFAVPDSLESKNELRDNSNFLPVSLDKLQTGNEYYKSFNSGVVLINLPHLPSDAYQSLIKLINPIDFSSNHTRHTDQFVMNKLLKGHVNFLPFKYNFLLNANNLERKKKNIQIAFVHYVEENKPWNLKGSENKYISLWYEYYANFKLERTVI